MATTEPGLIRRAQGRPPAPSNGQFRKAFLILLVYRLVLKRR